MTKTFAAAIASIVFFSGATLGSAQVLETSPWWKRVPTTTFVNADGPAALRKVAEAAGGKVEIDPRVKGRITLTLEDERVTPALERIAAHLDAYLRREEDETLKVLPARDIIPTSLKSFFKGSDEKRPRLDFDFDDVRIEQAAYAILGTGKIPYRFAPETRDGRVTLHLARVSRPRAFAGFLRAAGLRFRIRQDRIEIYRPRDPSEMSFDYEGARIRDILCLLFFDQKFSHVVVPEVLGALDAEVENQSFETALQIVTRKADATYRVEDGVYQIFPRIHCYEFPDEPSEPPPPPAPLGDQDDPLTRIVPSVEYQEADVREVLRQLFNRYGLAYSLAPDVQGTVTLSLKNVPFEVALQNVVRQVEATYRIEAGVFQVIRKVDFPPPSDAIPPLYVPVAAPSLTFDREHLYIVQYDHIFKLRKSDLREADQGQLEVSVTDGKGQPISPQRWIQWSQRKVDVAYKRKSIRDVVRELAALGNAQVRMDPEVSGEVTLEHKGITVAAALEEATRQVGARYRRDAGRLHVYRPVFSVGGASGWPFVPPGPEEPPTSAQDGDYLYVVRGHRVDKVRKRDLEVVAVGYLLLKPTPAEPMPTGPQGRG